MIDDVGRVEPAAEPDLDDCRIGRRTGEGQEGGRRRRLEEARLDTVARLPDLLQQCRELAILDQPAGNSDALIEAHEVRACEGMDIVARRLQRGAQESAGRALAVGAGDVEHRRQGVLGPSETIEQAGDSVETKTVPTGRQFRE